jgi:hypothetical protein
MAWWFGHVSEQVAAVEHALAEPSDPWSLGVLGCRPSGRTHQSDRAVNTHPGQWRSTGQR